MSYSCNAHGWQHIWQSCPNCQTYLYQSNHSANLNQELYYSCYLHQKAGSGSCTDCKANMFQNQTQPININNPLSTHTDSKILEKLDLIIELLTKEK